MPTSHRIDVDGGAIAAVTVGPDDEEPILLVSGGPGEARAWRYAVPEIVDQDAPARPFRFAAFDRRGVGGSSTMAPLRSAASIADDAAAVGRRLLGDRFHVVGISVGGMAAIELALRHPESVASLTLIATTAGGAGMTPPDQAYIDNVTSPPDDPHTALRDNLTLALSPGWPELHPDRFEQLVADMVASPVISDESNHALIEVFMTHDVADRLGDVVAPALAIGCEHDLVVPPANATYLAEHIPAARLELTSTGHAVDVERPDLLARLVFDHITAHPTC